MVTTVKVKISKENRIDQGALLEEENVASTPDGHVDINTSNGAVNKAQKPPFTPLTPVTLP